MLATQWNFKSIKTLAVNHLSAMTSPVDKIVLGRRYDISEWLGMAYTILCSRDEALTIKEGKLLGLEDVIKIAALRQGKNRSGFFPGPRTKTIRKTFGLLSVPHAGVEEGSQYLRRIQKKKKKGKHHPDFAYIDQALYDL
jgi:hypothetical protein